MTSTNPTTTEYKPEEVLAYNRASKEAKKNAKRKREVLLLSRFINWKSTTSSSETETEEETEQSYSSDLSEPMWLLASPKDHKIANLEEKVSSLEALVASLQNDLDLATKNVNKKENALISAKYSNAYKDVEIENLQVEQSRLSKVADNVFNLANKKIKEQESELQTAKDSAAIKQTEINNLLKKLLEKESKIETLQNNLDNTTTMLNSERKKSRERQVNEVILEDEVDRLKEQNKNLSNIVRKYEKSHHVLSERLEEEKTTKADLEVDLFKLKRESSEKKVEDEEKSTESSKDGGEKPFATVFSRLRVGKNEITVREESRIHIPPKAAFHYGETKEDPSDSSEEGQFEEFRPNSSQTDSPLKTFGRKNDLQEHLRTQDMFLETIVEKRNQHNTRNARLSSIISDGSTLVRGLVARHSQKDLAEKMTSPRMCHDL